VDTTQYVVILGLGIELFNLVLLLLLVRLFWNNYRRLRSPFTRGLLLFAIAFVMKSAITIVFIGAAYTMQDTLDQVPAGAVIPLAFNIFESAALIILLKVTNE
jgi:hypothetical protein